MSKPMIQPGRGGVIAINSVWADYYRGLVSAECVTWAHLTGFDVFGPIDGASAQVQYEAIREDADGYRETCPDDDDLIRYLRKSPVEFRQWWAAHMVLDEPFELYEAAEVHGPDGFARLVLSRAAELSLELIDRML